MGQGSRHQIEILLIVGKNKAIRPSAAKNNDPLNQGPEMHSWYPYGTQSYNVGKPKSANPLILLVPAAGFEPATP